MQAPRPLGTKQDKIVSLFWRQQRPVRVTRGRGEEYVLLQAKQVYRLILDMFWTGCLALHLLGLDWEATLRNLVRRTIRSGCHCLMVIGSFFYLFDLSCLVYGWFTKVVTKLMILRSIRLCFLIKFGNISLKLVLFLYQTMLNFWNQEINKKKKTVFKGIKKIHHDHDELTNFKPQFNLFERQFNLHEIHEISNSVFNDLTKTFHRHSVWSKKPF